MTAKWWAFGLWAAVAATAVTWGLKLFVPGTPVPERAAVAALAASPHGDLTRLLGADIVAVPQAMAAPSRFQLIGVVAPRGDFPSRDGVALIAIDGKPPKAYRVGAVIDGDTVLQAVAQRGARLGPRDGTAGVALDIPPPPPAATGQLPSPGGAPMAPPPMPAPAQSPLMQQQQMQPPRLPPPGTVPQRPQIQTLPQQPVSSDSQTQMERPQALPTQ